jgi:hypothetical protein
VCTGAPSAHRGAHIRRRRQRNGRCAFRLRSVRCIYLVIRRGTDAHAQLVPMTIAARGTNLSTRLRGRHVQALIERRFQRYQAAGLLLVHRRRPDFVSCTIDQFTATTHPTPQRRSRRAATADQQWTRHLTLQQFSSSACLARGAV